jgi:lysine-N-methylase
MTRFRCIAERCEDTCCSGLEVPVSEARLRVMRQLTAGSPEAERIQRCVRPEKGGPAGYAFIQRGPEGHCPFLDGERLCSLHRRHGEAALPDICASFPRVTLRVGERCEVAGTVACPEVARLCLLAEDAVDVVPAPELGVPRTEVARRVPEEARAFAERVRERVPRLLGRREFPLPSRLMFLARLALLLESLAEEEGAEQGGAELSDLLTHFEAPALLGSMHHDFAALEMTGSMCAGVFVSLLQARVAVVPSERFTTLFQGVLRSYGADGGAPFDADAAWHTYARRRVWLEAEHGARVHQYFHNDAVNHWMRALVQDASSLSAYAFRLALRMALLRFTLLGHPAVVALYEGATPHGDEARKVLDAAAVESFQLVARYVEAANDFLSLAEGLAGTGGGEELLGRTLVFAKFY